MLCYQGSQAISPSLPSPILPLGEQLTKVTIKYMFKFRHTNNSISGFESLTIDTTTNTLYAMLQSALMQDGGNDKSTSRYTRLFAWDVSNPSVSIQLVGEWVVPLPLSDKGNTEECNEIHFLGAGVFLALSRDGDGRGGDDNNSKYK